MVSCATLKHFGWLEHLVPSTHDSYKLKLNNTCQPIATLRHQGISFMLTEGSFDIYTSGKYHFYISAKTRFNTNFKGIF